MSSTLGRVLLFRHLAICASALMAYLLRQELEVGYAVLAVVTGSAVLNFGLYLLRVSPRAEPIAQFGSPVIGIGAWTALIAVTHGVGSPFLAGLWLEVLLAAMVFPPGGILVVTGAAVGALVAQQLWLGIAGREVVLALAVAFLCGVGGLAWAVKRRMVRREAELEREQQRLGQRLGALEVELEDERVLGRVGENVGRLAHGLKNQVHSLRGFTSLVERHVAPQGAAALEGLRTAIDDLEALARVTLEENAAIRAARERAGARSAEVVIERAVAEVRSTHPGVEWKVEVAAPLPAVAIDAEELEEVLLILLRNAIEAMGGAGRAELGARVHGGRLQIAVRDDGPGIAPDEVERIFRAGYTTKAEGSGYGLFLARRILAEHGGTLRARARRAGPGGAAERDGAARGAVFEVEVPLGPQAARRRSSS